MPSGIVLGQFTIAQSYFIFKLLKPIDESIHFKSQTQNGGVDPALTHHQEHEEHPPEPDRGARGRGAGSAAGPPREEGGHGGEDGQHDANGEYFLQIYSTT